MEGLRGIGRTARESGLSVSALRFYDGAGVLGPAHTDPHSGYRWYAPEQITEARLLAVLRRVGMPLPEIREVLAHRGDRAVVDTLLTAHLHRLERGLDDARRELSSVPDLLFPEENTMSRTVVTVAAPALAAALGSVRFAVAPAPAPDMAVLGGVLLDVSASAVTVVATDRYRLAVAEAAATDLTGPPSSAVLPAELADDLLALAGGGEPVEITLDDAGVTARCGDRSVAGAALDAPFPDYVPLLPAAVTDDAGGRTPAVTTVALLREQLAAADTRPLVRETDGRTTTVTSVAAGSGQELVVGAGGVGVDVDLLLEAAAVRGEGRVVLELGDPFSPITVRPAAEGTFSLLMPVRL